MINLFVEFGFQPLNMEALLDFDNATSFYQLKIKESFHIERLKPELSPQLKLSEQNAILQESN